MRIAIMQPGYLPWMGFFELMANCDLFVLLDDVQYGKKSWRNRNKIRTNDGWMWLTVPVLEKGRRKQEIKEATINNDLPWRRKHLKALKVNYSKAPFYEDYVGFFEQIYKKEWNYLIDLDVEIILFMAKQFGISTKIICSSSILISECSGNEHIIQICKKLNTDELSDTNAAKAFIDLELFNKSGIKVVFQNYIHPIYRQNFRPFLPYMSAVDLLFNEGPESKRILLSDENVA